MWDKLLCCLLAAAIFIFPGSVHGQNSSYFFQNLTCLTHDIEYLLCSWDSPLPQSADYNVCYRTPDAQRCFDTRESRLVVELKMFTTYYFQIVTMTDQGPAQITFEKSTQDIPFVPHTPVILSFTADDTSDILNVTWRWNTSSCLDGVVVKWEVQILRSENLIVVKTGQFTTVCDQRETEFQWQWTSEMSLECTSHSVRVRCYVEEEHYVGTVEWSEWSELKTVYGSPEENAYPQDRVVAVGSDITFCCTVNGEHSSIQFLSTMYPAIHISKNTSYIQLKNLNVSGDSGDNLICNNNKNVPIGSVIFVGYPPDKPQNFSCETPNLEEIECKWGLGRDTGLMGERSTIHELYESISKENKQCQEDTCSFKVIKDQNQYEFSLTASNDLGRSEAFLAIDVMERVHLNAPSKLSVREISPTQVSLSWQLAGRLTPLQLLCEIEKHTGNEGTNMFKATFSGLVDGIYNYTVKNLHPYHGYGFRVRCANDNPNHFWKWSPWSVSTRHHTSQAAPSRTPEIWREITETLENRTITIYWKPLSTADANGPVHSYEVSWKPLEGNAKAKRARLSSSHNNTQINLNNPEGDYEIDVQAANSAGLSPPSKITTVQLPNDHVEFEQQVGTADGINITWVQDTNVSCGHVIQWRPLFSSHPTSLMWVKLPAHRRSAFIPAALFPHGVRYNISVLGCEDNNYKLLKVVTGYTLELSPKVAPKFSVEKTTSQSVQLKWNAIPDGDLQGFLQGYVLYMKKDQDASLANSTDLSLRAEKEVMKNITNTTQLNLTLGSLQGGTRYELGLAAYTSSGEGPVYWENIVTNDSGIGLLLAILIPIVVAVLLGILISTMCYRKREWIKETFYPEIPNPENSKALQFQKNANEGNKNVKVLEMNPCTPNNVEVVQTAPKVLDTELNSPMTEDLIKLPEDGLDTDENHVVVSYCPPATSEDTGLDQSGVSSQVVYIDVQSMYQPQGNSEEELDDDLDCAGYKPQMHLTINTVKMDSHAPAEENLAEESGYRPQENPETWAGESPSSPSSLESNIDNASFGSPCSVNSRHFLIPPVDDKDSLKPTHVGWSISSLFQNKQDD